MVTVDELLVRPRLRAPALATPHPLNTTSEAWSAAVRARLRELKELRRLQHLVGVAPEADGDGDDDDEEVGVNVVNWRTAGMGADEKVR